MTTRLRATGYEGQKRIIKRIIRFSVAKINERIIMSIEEESPENKIDFTNPDLKVRIDISPEAEKHLPKISNEDLWQSQERFRFLYGYLEPQGPGEVKINITAVCELPDQPDTYTEGKGLVDKVNISKAKQKLDYATKKLGITGHIIGEIHTHPISQSELEAHQKPWHPSPEDEKAWISFYESGFLKADTPFIFGIAGAYENKTGYAFYRMVKKEGKWGIDRIE